MKKQIAAAPVERPLDQVKNLRAKAHNATNEIWFAITQLADRATCPELRRITNTQWRRIDMNKLHELTPGVLVPGVILEESFAIRHGLVDQLLDRLRHIKSAFDINHEQATALRAFCLMYRRLRYIVESDNVEVFIEAADVIRSSAQIRMDFLHLTQPDDGYLRVAVNNLQGTVLAPLIYRDAYCPL